MLVWPVFVIGLAVSDPYNIGNKARLASAMKALLVDAASSGRTCMKGA
jgi:hypothetical protein